MRLLLCFVLLTAQAAAWANDLIGPLREGNQTELARIGSQTGARGLTPELNSRDRIRTLAAIRAARGADDAWALLGLLAGRAGEPDRSVAMPAALVATEIAHDLNHYLIELEEIPTTDLLYLYGLWLKVAQEPRRWGDIRIYALETAETLRQTIPRSKRPTMPWPEFFTDRDAEIRSAALGLAPREKELEAEALSLLKDESRSVALSAAQWLCTPLGSLGYEPIDLQAELVKRLQEIAADKSLAVNARADLANCLIAEGSVESRRAIALLLQQSTPALRPALVALTKKFSAAP
jgi:hypothetical protein